MAAGSGVIFLKGIPDGFFEHEQRDYFSQFGRVSKVRVLRSKKTNRSRGCAWVRFDDPAVAQIAADTMHNYLMHNALIKCVHLPVGQVPEHLFDVKSRSPYWRSKIAAKQQNSVKSTQKLKKQRKRLLSHLTATNKKLAEMGIEYRFDAKDIVGMNGTDADDDDIKLDVKTEPVAIATDDDVQYSSDSDVQEDVDTSTTTTTSPKSAKKTKTSRNNNNSKLTSQQEQPSTSTPKLLGDASKYGRLLDQNDSVIEFDVATTPRATKRSRKDVLRETSKSVDTTADYATANDSSNYGTPEASFTTKRAKKEKKLKPKRAVKG